MTAGNLFGLYLLLEIFWESIERSRSYALSLANDTTFWTSG